MCHFEGNFNEVKDGDEINLGSRTLKFYMTPMVHWPETMMTYDTKDKILFSGDAFGGFGSLDGGIFDDEVDISYFENEIRRYYSNIVGKFGPMVQKALQKLSGLDIKLFVQPMDQSGEQIPCISLVPMIDGVSMNMKKVLL